MATALLMLLPAAAAVYGLSQNENQQQTNPPVDTPPVDAPPVDTGGTSSKEYRTYNRMLVNARTMTDFRKSHAAKPAASRYLHNQSVRNDGPKPLPNLAAATSLYGKGVYSSNLYNSEPTTLKKAGTFKNFKGNVFQQYENKDPDPTGVYHTNTKGRNRLQTMIGQDDLFKRKNRDRSINFHGKNDLIRTDILPMDTRSRVKESINADIQNNLNGSLPSNSNIVTQAPFGMAMEGGHFMLRPKPRLAESMRHEVTKQEETNPRQRQSNVDKGGATLRGKIRLNTNKTTDGRVGNKQSEVDLPQAQGKMTHCRDGTANMKLNPLMQVDLKQTTTPFESFDDVKLSKNRVMKGGSKVAQVETFGPKSRDTKMVSCTNRVKRVKRNPTMIVGKYGVEARKSTFSKNSTKRSMKKYRKEVEEALNNGVVLRAENPCMMVNRTTAGPEPILNRDIIENGQAPIGEHSVKRQNAGYKLEQPQQAPKEGTTRHMDVGAPESMKNLTTENRTAAASFETNTRQNPLLTTTCNHETFTLPMKQSIAFGNRLPVTNTSGDSGYLN